MRNEASICHILQDECAITSFFANVPNIYKVIIYQGIKKAQKNKIHND